MAEERFDLSYKGDLVPGADPARARERLTALFKLSEAGAERLFTGRPVIVKRNADAATAARFTEVFEQAGALLTVTPLDTLLDTDALSPTSGNTTDAASAAHRNPPSPPESSDDSGIDTPPLALATTQDDFLEPTRTVNIAAFDTGELSLVSGQDWSLADCEPPPTPIPIPDIDYLSLAEMEPPTERPRSEIKAPPD
ncbi:hypothetical protein [Thiocapsa roseopersicina]|uniref:Uncharacterized protein n=1 Tax=Thiocapsa roseopersicina TaxID=1058 RepID=A0A1H2W936_THIRO|nr:hypothetical protein [Thiocapsa roseopersicina]SDW77067.1 hypothetical protein SAMN05421783_10896 [Thiocapsa roseopersicina]